ncbi:MAG TPA: NAD(P)-dependent alcohol dehydrogenase [Pyrinomonadaceae bacterium]|nr:NAD(P)-dependent alcohol dehydrogenase [Pyrinomonadaceae bacterium]
MKAIVYHEHGSADVLKLEDVEKPVPKDNEVLIKVRAASINPLDWRLMRGEPKIIRVMAKLMGGTGTGRPGVDVAGEVEAVGSNVKKFKVGDGVFGSCVGALAEYACAGEAKVTLKPVGVTFEQAASINVAGLTALQGLRDKAKLQRGEKALINGAAGGVGTFAVQVAKHLGAEVTGVCSTRNVEMVRSIGADRTIDYTKEDFVNLPERYDVIFECVGNKSPSQLQSVLKPNGRSIGVGAPHDLSMIGLLASAISAMRLSMFSDRKVTSFLAKGNADDLAFIGNLIVSGELTPVIDRVYDLTECADAMRHLEEGHARGKVIVAVGGER